MKTRLLLLTVVAVGFIVSFRSAYCQSGQWKTLHTNYIVAYDMHFTSDDTGYISGEHTIVKTTDGGVTFTAMNLPVDTGHTNFESMSWPTSQIGYVCGALDSTNTGLDTKTVIVKTTNAGNTWTRLPIDSMFGLIKIDFPTPDIGYYIGYSGKAGSSLPARLAKTTDGGMNWKTIIFDDTFLVSMISFRNEREGFFGHQRVFGTITASDLIYTNDGLTTTSVRGDSVAPINDIISLIPLEDGSWLITADGNLWRTTNAGLNWHSVTIPNEFSAAILAASGNLVFEVNNSLSIDYANASIDFGKTWTATTTLSDTGFVEQMTMPSKRTAYLYMQSNNPDLRHELLKWTNTDNLAVTSNAVLPMQSNVTYLEKEVILHYPSDANASPIIVSDILGRTVPIELRANRDGATHIATASLPQGVYLASVNRLRYKFVIEH